MRIVLSEVFVVWGSLDVLDVGFFFVCNTAICELLSGDWFAATVFHLATALPVPVETTNIFETSHLFVSEFSYDFEHLSTVAVHAENLVTKEVLLEENLLENEGANDEAANNPLC